MTHGDRPVLINPVTATSTLCLIHLVNDLDGNGPAGPALCGLTPRKAWRATRAEATCVTCRMRQETNDLRWLDLIDQGEDL